jgi:hypothetical protein
MHSLAHLDDACMLACDMQQPLHHVTSLLHTCTRRSSATSIAAAGSASAFVALPTAAVCATPLLLLPSDAAARGGMCQAADAMTLKAVRSSLQCHYWVTLDCGKTTALSVWM